MRYLEIEAKIAGMAKNLDRRYIRAFWIAFALVNLAFLFYTVNFMFGDHDWNYVRGASAWNEGALRGVRCILFCRRFCLTGRCCRF